MPCKDCELASEAASDRHGLNVQTLCVKCREALLDKVQRKPMSGKKGNHVRERNHQ